MQKSGTDIEGDTIYNQFVCGYIDNMIMCVLNYRTHAEVGAGNPTDTCTLEVGNKYLKTVAQNGAERIRQPILSAIKSITDATKV